MILKLPTPRESPAVGGGIAFPSLETAVRESAKFVSTLPKLSLAVTVKLKMVPAVVVLLRPETSSCEAGAGFKVIELLTLHHWYRRE